MAFARQRYGPDALGKAWDSFTLSVDIPFSKAHPDAEFFLRWIVFDWRPQNIETLAEMFLAEKGAGLDGDLGRFIEATLCSPYSFFQVLETNPGIGFRLRDLLRDSDFYVTERLASGEVDRGVILYARVVELQGVTFMLGCGNSGIRPSHLNRVLNLRAAFQKESPARNAALDSAALLIHEPQLRAEYFKLSAAMLPGKPDIRNSDGDPVDFITMTFQIPSLQAAFQSLKALEQRANGRPDASFFEDAETYASGRPAKLTIHWLKPPPPGRTHGATLLATLVLTPTKLIVEVDSEKRAKRARKEITKRLGGSAVLLRSEVTTLEGALRKAEKRKAARPADESDKLLLKSPEAMAMVKGMMDEHWATWPDIPLPALNGMTPRSAALDPANRQLVESLLMEFELRNRDQKDENFRIDIPKLRKVLGLASQSGKH